MKKMCSIVIALIFSLMVHAVTVNNVTGGYRGALTVGTDACGDKTVYMLPGLETGTVSLVLPDFNYMGGSLGDIVLVNIPMSSAGVLDVENYSLYLKAIDTRAFVTMTNSKLTAQSTTLSMTIHVQGLNPIAVAFNGSKVNDNYTFTNGGFEGSWSNNEPSGWHSFVSAAGSFNAFVKSNTEQFTQSSDVRPGSTGTHSARLSTKTILGTRANGNCTNGQINAGSTSAGDGTKNYNFSDPSNTGYNTPFVGNPDSIVFWAKYVPGGSVTNSNNQARMSVTITTNARYQDPEDGLNASSTKIASAVREYSATASKGWQRLSTPFTYTSLDPKNAAYVLVTFTTNKTAGGGTDGTDYVYLDDVEMVYNYTLKSFTQDGAAVTFTNGIATTDAEYSDSLYTFSAAANGKAAQTFLGFDAIRHKVCLYVLPQDYTQSLNYAVYELQMAEPHTIAATYNEYDATICSNETYTDELFDQLTLAGDYTTTLVNVAGGDSIVTLHLTVYPAYRSSESKTIMQGEAFQWNDKAYYNMFPVGDYTDSVVYQTAFGCDSVEVLQLAVVNDPTMLPQYGSYNALICQGTSIEYNNVVYDEPFSGDVLLTVPNQYGGDSIVHLTVQTIPSYRIEEDMLIAQGEDIQWHTVDLSTMSVGELTLEAAYNSTFDCDSIHVLHLSVQNANDQLVADPADEE